MTDHDPLCYEVDPWQQCICGQLERARAGERAKVYRSIQTNDSAAGLIIRGIIAQAVRDERERIAQREEWAVLYDGDPKMDGGYERRELGRWFSEEKARAAMASAQVRDRSGSKPNLRMEMRYVTGWEAR